MGGASYAGKLCVSSVVSQDTVSNVFSCFGSCLKEKQIDVVRAIVEYQDARFVYCIVWILFT